MIRVQVTGPDAEVLIRAVLQQPTSRERVHALARSYGLSSLQWRERAEQGEALAGMVADADMKTALQLWHRLGMIR